MLYSVRMRAAQGAPHEQGGRHISGAERLVCRQEVAGLTQTMLERAFFHSRGEADFINITVEAIAPETIQTVPILPVTEMEAPDYEAGRGAAQIVLAAVGVNPAAAAEGFAQLLALPDSMRGAMLICAQTGKRLDTSGMRGVRVSRMDVDNEAVYTEWLAKQGFSGIHIREALVLASKVAAAHGIVAELCWSDDPEYTAGYVASSCTYFRFAHLKPQGCTQGGRLFFVRPGSDIEALQEYLTRQPVLVVVPEVVKQ